MHTVHRRGDNDAMSNEVAAAHPLTPIGEGRFSTADFIAMEGHRGSDFSDVTVLTPHPHAAALLRETLRERLGLAAMIPPRCLTLSQLAGTTPTSAHVEADSRRLAELYDLLRQTGQFPEGVLWQASRELFELLAALDEAEIDLEAPAVRALLDNRRNPALALEAAVTREVWRALRHGAPSAARDQALRLRARAESADAPLYVFGLDPEEAAAFLRVWRARAPVRLLDLDDSDTRPTTLRAFLDLAWRVTDAPLKHRARQAREQHPRSPLQDCVAIQAANDLEAAARAAEAQVLGWLEGGLRDIALIANDRLLARRLRALLERRGILARDETGWAFSTAAVSQVVERLLCLTAPRVSRRDVLDLLKSGFILGGQADLRQRAAHELDACLRQHLAPDDLAGYVALAREHRLEAAETVLRGLVDTVRALGRGKRPLAEWTQALLTALGQLDALSALEADAIGAQLLTLLHRLQAETQDLRARFALREWRQWLLMHLEQETFSDASLQSPLRFTHLGAAHHRRLDAALVLGSGAHHLPGVTRASLFNDATLRQLGLRDRESRETRQRAQLQDILARTPRVALIWQASDGGNPAPLSPWLIQLDALHQAAWGRSLIHAAQTPRAAPLPLPPPVPFDPPRATSLPERMSVSAWQSLVACPYQFYARALLGLREREETEDEMDKAEYGQLVHAVLARFHAAHPRLDDHDAEHWLPLLEQHTDAVFGPLARTRYQAEIWRLRWARQLRPYLDWAVAWARQGWTFQAAEHPLERSLAWDEGREIRLYGRADRLDARAAALAVLDYKTQARATLKRKLDPAGEDVQLATYAWLAGARADVAAAGFIGLDEARVQCHSPADIAERAAAEAERIAQTLRDLAQGQSLPANAAPATCAWCEMRGLCRRAHQDEGRKPAAPEPRAAA